MHNVDMLASNNAALLATRDSWFLTQVMQLQEVNLPPDLLSPYHTSQVGPCRMKMRSIDTDLKSLGAAVESNIYARE